MNPYEKACKEFLKGCSDTVNSEPENCPVCTTAFREHIQRLVIAETNEKYCKFWDCGWCYKIGSNHNSECIGYDECRYIKEGNENLSFEAKQNCVDIYSDFTEEEAKLQTKSIYNAWGTGKELVERLKNCYQQEYRRD